MVCVLLFLLVLTVGAVSVVLDHYLAETNRLIVEQNTLHSKLNETLKKKFD